MSLNPLNLFSYLAARRLPKVMQRYSSRPSAETAAHAAKQLVRCGRGDQALKLIKDARRLFPGNATVSEVHLSIRRHQARAALKKANRLLKHRPKIDLFLRISELHRTLGEFDRSLKWLEKAGKRFPDHWAVEVTLGKLSSSRYRGSRAKADAVKSLQHLGRALELNPNNYQVLIHSAIVNTHLGHLDEAAELLRTIQARFPDDPKANELVKHVQRSLSKADVSRPAATQEKQSRARRKTPPAAAASSAEAPPEGNGIDGAFVLDETGALALQGGSRSGPFVLTDADTVVKTMVADCRYGSTNIGIGDLESCHLVGDDWQVYLRATDSKHVVLFSDGTTDDLMTIADETLAQLAVA